jgi:hypothetical protein
MKIVLRVWGSLVLGVLIGASFMAVHTSRQIEQLMYSVRVLNEELATVRQEAEELRTSLSTEKQEVVTGIQVDIHFTDDLTAHEEREARLAIEKKVKEWLEPLYGEELNNLNPRMVPRIIDGREVQVEIKNFQLVTSIVFVSEEILVCLDATIYQPEEHSGHQSSVVRSQKLDW